MKKIKLEASYIKRKEGRSRLCSDVQWNNRSRTLWFEVEREFEEFLCYERADGFLTALLPFALLNNLDIEVDGYISERLLYQFNTLLIPVLSSNRSQFHPVTIDAKIDNTLLKSQNAVGTGLTCGIDSFYTVLKHMNCVDESFKLTHLTFFNIMNSEIWKDYGNDSSRDFFKASIKYIKPVVKEFGLKFVSVDTNFDLMYGNLSLIETYTYRYFGVVLALQKLFKHYYWSSGYQVSQFSMTPLDISSSDLLSVQYVSNENTVFYSAGSAVGRIEKTKYISDFDITYKYLKVCWLRVHNCTLRCDKCKRTIISLYAIGKLDYYDKVFDLEYFYKHLDEYVGHMLLGNTQSHVKDIYSEILRCYLDNNLKITFKARLYSKKMTISLLKHQIVTKKKK